MIYWTSCPVHKNFIDTEYRIKMNLCLESIVKLFTNMRVIKLKEHWDPKLDIFVDKDGKITFEGLDAYWKSIDSSFEFNVKKRENFLKYNRREAPRPFTHTVTKTNGSSPRTNAVNRNETPLVRDVMARRMKEFFQRRKDWGNDRFHWRRPGAGKDSRKGKKLPRPPYE